jgi:sulfotransferase family protein
MNTKVLYVLGTQRGGSTIVGRLTGALPGFAYGGEMRRLWERGADPDVRCGCGADHATCPVWSVALPRTLAGASLAEARAWQRAAAPDRRSSWRVVSGGGDERYDALMGRLYREFATASDARVVVDASKQPADALVAGRSGADAYVLHLVRDPRGVAYSLAKRSDAHAAAVVKASALWTGRNVAASLVRRAVGRNRFLVLRYEDVMADPQAALTHVAAFVGEEVAVVVEPDGKVALPTAHTPTGNGRFVAESTVLVEDRAWATALGSKDRALASALTAPLRWRYGYGTRP